VKTLEPSNKSTPIIWKQNTTIITLLPKPNLTYQIFPFTNLRLWWSFVLIKLTFYLFADIRPSYTLGIARYILLSSLFFIEKLKDCSHHFTKNTKTYKLFISHFSLFTSSSHFSLFEAQPFSFLSHWSSAPNHSLSGII
jgi:hypothetical protein